MSLGLNAQNDTDHVNDNNVPSQIDTSAQNAASASTVAQVETLKVAEKRVSKNRTGLFLLFLFIFLLFGLLRFFHPKYISGLFRLYTQGQMVNQSAIGQLQSNNAPKVLFTLIYFIAAGFVGVKLFYYFTGKDLCTNDIALIGLGVLLFFSTFLIKYTIVSTLAWVFNFKKGIKGLFHYLNFANQIVGIILLPICALLLLCLEKGSVFLIILGVVILSISLIVRYIYNFAYLKQLPNVNIFHFILYLCAFEIIPMGVLGRFMLDNF